jgi:hypothetical protein
MLHSVDQIGERRLYRGIGNCDVTAVVSLKSANDRC